jgi:hypothetical protein
LTTSSSGVDAPKTQAPASRQKATASADHGKPNENSRRGVATPSDNSRLAQALRLAREYDFAVFPVRPGKKLPAMADWQKVATSNPDKLAAFWSPDHLAIGKTRDGRVVYSNPDYNIGVACGGGADGVKLIVVDCDVKGGADGPGNLMRLAGEYATDLANTLTFATPSGGRHFVFRAPNGLCVPDNSVGKIAPGIDIRSAGGLIVAPGSVTDKGVYSVVDGAPPLDAPAWLLDPIAAAASRLRDEVKLSVSIAPDHPADIAEAKWWLANAARPAIQGQGGDSTTIATAAKLHGLGIAEATALDLMTEYYNVDGRCVPLWEPDDLAKKVANGYCYAREPFGIDSIQVDFDDLGDEEADAVGAANDNGGDDTRRKAGTRVLTSGEFVASIRAPNWLIRGIVRRRFFYTLTAATGTGKTALSLLLAASVALGRAIGEHRVSKGRVLYLAGENPDDIGTRWIAMAEKLGFDPTAIDTRFVAGVVDIRKALPVLRENAEAWGGFDLIIVDTVAAYSTMIVKDENDNAQMGAFAEVLRQLVDLPGGPCVIACAHPTKGIGKTASPDELMPRGGGAFIAAVDGNLTLNADADNDVIYLRHNKLRGPGFDKLAFKLDTIETDRILTEDGERMPTVVARHIGEDEEIARRNAALVRQDEALRVIVAHPLSSLVDLARFAGWKNKNGNPDKRKMQTAVDNLEGLKLVRKIGGQPEATSGGKKRLAALDARLFGDSVVEHGLN